jgi:hypothetical protein
MDVFFWRSGWDANATAVAFKCGPPEGHDAEERIARLKDWRLEDGHVHPDVNSFILFADGKYLTGDSGYAGVPRTVEHNTLLVDGQGQGHEGTHDAWGKLPYAQLNGIRITNVEANAQGFRVTGEGAAAYDKALGLTRFARTLSLRGHTLDVSDAIADVKPVMLTEVLHSDTTISAAGANAFVLPGLKVELLAPRGAGAKIEPNVVMGPGRPGSVDKGTPETRGERLLVTTPAPVAGAEFRWVLRF